MVFSITVQLDPQRGLFPSRFHTEILFAFLFYHTPAHLIILY